MALVKRTRNNWSFLKSIFQKGCRIFSIRRKKQVIMVSDVKEFQIVLQIRFFIYCKNVVLKNIKILRFHVAKELVKLTLKFLIKCHVAELNRRIILKSQIGFLYATELGMNEIKIKAQNCFTIYSR